MLAPAPPAHDRLAAAHRRRSSLLAALVTALLITPDQMRRGRWRHGSATTEYLRLFLVLGSAVGLLLALVGAAGGHAAATRPR